MFSPLSNMKASDKTSKSSLRDVFEADVVCCEKTTSTSFAIIKIKRLTLMLTASHVKQIDGRQWRHKPKLLKNNFTCY